MVLDSCMGSGTTAVACIKTGRNYIGFETDEGYFAAANERIKRWESRADTADERETEKDGEQLSLFAM